MRLAAVPDLSWGEYRLYVDGLLAADTRINRLLTPTDKDEEVDDGG